jgi:SAM-dependent methyltransferase
MCGEILVEIGTILSLLPPPPACLLELGCGTGWASCFFARRGYRVTGQDISPDMIASAEANKRREALPNLTFLVSDYEALPFREEFDCAVFFDSLHHAVDEVKALEGAFTALKPGGLCVLSEPGRGHSRSADAVEAVRKYGVSEKDMPPDRIRRIGLTVGFSQFRVLPQLRTLCSILCRPDRLRRNHPLIAKVLGLSGMKFGAALVLLLTARYRAGVVVLTK